MTPQQLEDWLYACLPSRPTLEKAATSRVSSWSWAKGGLWQPHDPLPYAARSGPFSIARTVKTKPADKKGAWETGVDDEGRVHVVRAWRGNKKPEVALYLYEPGIIRRVSYGDEYGVPVQGVWELTLDEAGLAKARRSYSNVFGFPQTLTPASIRAHQQKATAVRLHHRYVWKRGLLARIEVELHGGKGWGIERGFEHDAKGTLTSVWRPHGTAKEVLWP